MEIDYLRIITNPAPNIFTVTLRRWWIEFNLSLPRKGKIELDPPPPKRNGEDIWSRICDYPKIVDLHTIARDKPERPEGYGVTHNWDRRSIFWDIPYWKVPLLRHNIDV